MFHTSVSFSAAVAILACPFVCQLRGETGSCCRPTGPLLHVGSFCCGPIPTSAEIRSNGARPPAAPTPTPPARNRSAESSCICRGALMPKNCDLFFTKPLEIPSPAAWLSGSLSPVYNVRLAAQRAPHERVLPPLLSGRHRRLAEQSWLC